MAFDFKIGLLAVVLSGAAPLTAAQFDSIYAFGDSLSDAGNVFIATGGTTPGLPYFNGQFSNGPIWLEDLAAQLGLPALTPSLAGGTDFAFGDAQSGTTLFHNAAALDLLGPSGQVAQFLGATGGVADPGALYTIWIGSNDLAAIPSGATNAQIAADLGGIAGNIDTAIGDLASAGAKNFLVVTVPDLGKAPGAGAAASAASQLSASFDTTLVNGGGPIPSLAGVAAADSVNISVLNAYALLDSIVNNPGFFHLTDVTDACLVGAVNFSGGTPCANPNQYLFWDPSGHPTAAAGVIIANAAQNAIPEPSAVMLGAAGLVAVALMRRKRNSAFI
jgi:phospholipase/lecithinase/hemolysin